MTSSALRSRPWAAPICLQAWTVMSPMGPGAKDGDIIPRDITAGRVQPVQASPGGGQQHGVLERHLRRQLVGRADVVQDVSREAAIRGDAGGVMAFGCDTVVQTGGIFANQTVITPSAAVMRFNTDLVTHGELVDGPHQGHYGPGPLLPGRKGAVRQGRPELPVAHLEVAATRPTHGDLWRP
jgi:hypothetical protein